MCSLSESEDCRLLVGSTGVRLLLAKDGGDEDKLLLQAPIHMLATVGFVKETDCNRLIVRYGVVFVFS